MTELTGGVAGPGGAARRERVSRAVKRLVAVESRLSMDPERIGDDEPLNGKLLKVNSLGFLGVMVRLEDELDVTLPDDLFMGRSFTTVADLVDVVLLAVPDAAAAEESR